ncbi:MAG TPA: acyl-CoA reductase [Candidatus Binataceae bacterium]|nr:acyl-CoA reductase [Candidatus Binataceae bacterium]
MTEASELGLRARPDEMHDAMARLRGECARFTESRRIAEALASACEEWRAGNSPEYRSAIAELSTLLKWSRGVLAASLEALLMPFSRDALLSFAVSAHPREQIGGFIMPANVPGAGMHELIAALISGAVAIVKASVREPVLFPAFAQTLRRIDPLVGNRVEVVVFGREREDLTRIMCDQCDFIVALGEDAGLAHLIGRAKLFGFGSRVSGALISLATPANFAALAAAVARDVVLFEQQGCLSPHHIFIADADRGAIGEFARRLADALAHAATAVPPAALSFNTAAAIRRMRERARWRQIGGHDIELLEDRAGAWTIVIDPEARLTISPGYRAVTLSVVRDADDLAARLAPVAGRLEAFALAAAGPVRGRFLDVLAGAGVTYVCDPGQMQSPPLTWPHGGGKFLDFLASYDE